MLFGFGLATALAAGWRRLLGAESDPAPSWQGTDNDPEDNVAMDDALAERAREAAPFDYEREETTERTKPS